MSIPPQTIKVKRKRDDSETPVTFLQFSQEGSKRHRTGDENNWVYQRRQSTARTNLPVSTPQLVKPVIHVSKPKTDAPNKQDGDSKPPESLPRKTLSPKPSAQRLRPELRRFHLSRSMIDEGNGQPSSNRVSKKGRSGPAVFVEKSKNKKKIASKLENLSRPKGEEQSAPDDMDLNTTAAARPSEPERKLKKPGTMRAKSPKPDGPERAPLPTTRSQSRTEDMDQIAQDMNAWVLNEIGANLHEMEEEKRKEQKRRFKPKVPAQRYAERHPESVQETPAMDATMVDASGDEDDEGDGDDWVIEEYIRVPAKSISADILPGEVGVLVLDGEEDNSFFFGPEEDDDDYLEDDEDENAENHYTADYPEDEVDSDDEFNRYAYLYRTGNASDNEEFDNDNYSDHSDEDDKIIMEGDDEFNHDVAMARIKAYNLQRKRAMGMDIDY